MKTRLYYYPGNANLAPHILLEEAGHDFELVLVDRTKLEHKSEAYLRLNPNGTIPTFVSDNLVLFEAAAICLHIAERSDSLAPPPPGSVERAHLYKWLFFLSNTVQPAYMAFRYPEAFVSTSVNPSEPHDTASLVSSIRASALRRMLQAFQVIERSFTDTGPYLLGSRYSAADAYLYMLTWWARSIPDSPANSPRIAGCTAAVAERPATQRACTAEGIEVFRQASVG